LAISRATSLRAEECASITLPLSPFPDQAALAGNDRSGQLKLTLGKRMRSDGRRPAGNDHFGPTIFSFSLRTAAAFLVH